MRVQSSKVYYRGAGGFDEELEIVVRENAGIVICRNAQQKDHSCECGAGITFVYVRYCEFTK